MSDVKLPEASYIPEMSTEELLALIEDAGRQIEEATNVAPDVYALYGRGVRMMAAELNKRGVQSATHGLGRNPSSTEGMPPLPARA